jgi:hypothetical protein
VSVAGVCHPQHIVPYFDILSGVFADEFSEHFSKLSLTSHARRDDQNQVFFQNSNGNGRLPCCRVMMMIEEAPYLHLCNGWP